MAGIQYPNNRLRELRLSKKISLRALSEKTGVDFATISYCEKGRRNFSATSLKALADFFGVSTDYILGAEPEVMYNDFIDSIRRAFYVTDIDAQGEACTGLASSIEKPLRTKLEILFILKDLNDQVSLDEIYKLCSQLSAKADFS